MAHVISGAGAADIGNFTVLEVHPRGAFLDLPGLDAAGCVDCSTVDESNVGAAAIDATAGGAVGIVVPIRDGEAERLAVTAARTEGHAAERVFKPQILQHDKVRMAGPQAAGIIAPARLQLGSVAAVDDKTLDFNMLDDRLDGAGANPRNVNADGDYIHAPGAIFQLDRCTRAVKMGPI